MLQLNASVSVLHSPFCNTFSDLYCLDALNSFVNSSDEIKDNVVELVEPLLLRPPVIVVELSTLDLFLSILYGESSF